MYYAADYVDSVNCQKDSKINPLIHNAPNGQTHFKDLAAFVVDNCRRIA